MARPERNNVDYFPFICEEGNKMFYIEETYGNDGFATFVKLLRELAKTNNHYLDLSKPTTVMFLSAKCKVSKDVLLAIVNDLVEVGKFDPVLWNENKIIWCQYFIDSIQDAYFKRKNKCITYDGLLLLLISLGIRKPVKSKPTVPDKPQSIEEDTKLNENKENDILLVKETKLNITERKKLFYESLIPFSETYDKATLRDFYEYWTEHGEKDLKFRKEKEKTFGLERRLKTWSNNNFNNKQNGKSKIVDTDEFKQINQAIRETGVRR